MSLELEQLLIMYSMRSIKDWKSASPDIKRRAGMCLRNKIASTEELAEKTIKSRFNKAKSINLDFIPMANQPGVGTAGCYEWAFFVPILEQQGKDIRASFDLFLLVRNQDCLAFRFEPPESDHRHNYHHIQMVKHALVRKTQPTNALDWVPDSYPAFPIRAMGSVEMFLCMATAVHGYSDGIDRLIVEMCQNASRSDQISKYKEAIAAVLN